MVLDILEVLRILISKLDELWDVVRDTIELVELYNEW